MGLGLAVTGALMTFFVHRIARALSAQRQELERLRRQAREDRYVASLGALSAGAAHELGTPRGTIALLSGELELMGAEERSDAIAQISRERYLEEVAKRMRADGSAYTLMANDLYSLGYYLAHYKYPYLRWAYIFLLSGFVVAGLTEATLLLIR